MDLLAPGLIAALVGYLAGSVPFGLLIGKIVAGVDIRDAGSGNIGATNVARVVGGLWGAIVLTLDALKGMLPVLWLPELLVPAGDPGKTHLAVICGVTVIAGHMFPCWLRFKGGKGVATALGVVFILAWEASLVAASVFLLSMAAFRIVSLSSILAVSGFAVFELWLLGPDAISPERWSLAAFSTLVPLLIIVRHRSNIGRLLRGEEPKFQPRRNKIQDDSPTGAGPENSSGEAG